MGIVTTSSIQSSTPLFLTCPDRDLRQSCNHREWRVDGSDLLPSQTPRYSDQQSEMGPVLPFCSLQAWSRALMDVLRAADIPHSIGGIPFSRKATPIDSCGRETSHNNICTAATGSINFGLLYCLDDRYLLTPYSPKLTQVVEFASEEQPP